MIGVICWIISAFTCFCAATGHILFGTELNHANVVCLWILTVVFAVIGIISFFAKSRYSGGSSNSSSHEGGFSGFIFGGGSDSSDSGSCGGSD